MFAHSLELKKTPIETLENRVQCKLSTKMKAGIIGSNTIFYIKITHADVKGRLEIKLLSF
jgi:hypothetical protein